MLHLFEKNIENHFPDILGKKMLVAVSGGIDSMVLVDLLMKSRQNIALAHVNFKLRAADSDADQAFVKNYALKKNILFFTKEFETKIFAQSNKLSIQEAARKLRYDWFEELIETHHFDFLLTAHHLDDSLETFLIHLSRGTGIDGLLGIPERNEKIVRPLLPFSKEEIVQYANAENLTWQEDCSNQSDAYLRNRIRHHVVPELKKLNEDFLGNFQKTLKQLQSSAAFIKNRIESFKSMHFHKTKNGIEIPVEALSDYKPEESFLFELFKPYHFTDWKALKELLEAQSGKQLFSATHRLIKDRNKLILTELNTESIEDEFFIEGNNTEIVHPIHLKISDADTIQKGNNSH
jgi:tRNA(Ile)-lysidine synthase